mmetsp:Transcript_37903/g.89321  ORF Transcript_37903/g.89321 Transcript_37903/m.89321 type:complete len:210 (+) Transcript_37903:4306-4935(+)
MPCHSAQSLRSLLAEYGFQKPRRGFADKQTIKRSEHLALSFRVQVFHEQEIALRDSNRHRHGARSIRRSRGHNRPISEHAPDIDPLSRRFDKPPKESQPMFDLGDFCASTFQLRCPGRRLHWFRFFRCSRLTRFPSFPSLLHSFPFPLIRSFFHHHNHVGVRFSIGGSFILVPAFLPPFIYPLADSRTLIRGFSIRLKTAGYPVDTFRS